MDPYARPGKGRASFGGLEASSLYCRRCAKAQPVRRKLLLVLPQGEKYAYYCTVCGDEVGSKLEQTTPPS
ncbi:MAG: cytoplasmic protein [Pseudomonadota bacterium]